MTATALGWLQNLWYHVRRQGARAASVAVRGGREETPWEVIYVASNRMEAEVIRGRLESEDIPVVLSGEAVGAVFGLATGPLAQVEVLVPAPLAERARALLSIADPIQVDRDDKGHSEA